MPTSSVAINVRFSGVIATKPNLNGKKLCFLKMSFFSKKKLSFSQFKLGFGSMTPKKMDLIKWWQQLNWYPETSFYTNLAKFSLKPIIQFDALHY